MDQTARPAATASSPEREAEVFGREQGVTSPRAGYFRWVICTLLLLGTTKNYMDRQLLGVLKTTLQHDLGWNDIDYGNIVVAFQGAYALGMVVSGWVVDRVGTRYGYALAMVFWSLVSMGHALCTSFGSFLLARSALGFGEAGGFSASLRTVGGRVPEKKRARGPGRLNAGTAVGASITPFLSTSGVRRIGLA